MATQLPMVFQHTSVEQCSPCADYWLANSYLYSRGGRWGGLVNGFHTFLEAALITITLTAPTKVAIFVIISVYMRFRSSSIQALRSLTFIPVWTLIPLNIYNFAFWFSVIWWLCSWRKS